MTFLAILGGLWLLIALIVSGCGLFHIMTQPRDGQFVYTQQPQFAGPAVRTIPIWIDKDFGESDKLAIDDAIKAWNYALNGYIKLQVVDTEFDMEIPKIVEQVKANGWLFMKINSDNPMVPALANGYRTVGFCERVGGNHLYLVRDRLFNQDVFGVTMHEMGHLLGSGHVGEHLMYPHFSRARFQCVDHETLEKVADYNHIPLDRLNFCVDTDGMGNVVKDKGDGGKEEISCPLGD